jgi:uncharacterized protein YbjT (DUF2867 family)
MPPRGVTVAVLGATGMVGVEVLHASFDEPRVSRVVAVGRRPTGVAHAKIHEVIVGDLADLAPAAGALREVDLFVYCVGVYTGRVPEDEFFRITCDYLEGLLTLLTDMGSRATFCLMSAGGADPTEKSRMVFARAKGRAERMLLESPLPSKYIFRPGYIAPGRQKSRTRIPDWLALPAYRLFPFMGIDAAALARTMLLVGLEQGPQTLFENSDIRRYAEAHPRRNPR